MLGRRLAHIGHKIMIMTKRSCLFYCIALYFLAVCSSQNYAVNWSSKQQ